MDRGAVASGHDRGDGRAPRTAGAPTPTGEASLTSQPWLARIVVNTCRDRLKRSRRRRMEAESERGHAHVDPATDGRADPEAHVAGREIARKIAEHIGTLPDMQRDVIALRYYEDRSLAEIAALLRVSVGTVKTHLFRATRRIRRSIEALYGTRLPF